MVSVVKRLDYHPLNYQIDQIRLVFDLARDQTLVKAELDILCADTTKHIQLDGHQIKLEEIFIDHHALKDSDYDYDGKKLTFKPAGSHFTLKTTCRLFPAENRSLEGLFVTGSHLCTQCEPEGFRHITFFPDRPDILARYHVTLRASFEEFPILLSNGNEVGSSLLEDGRHQKIFEDPFKKPCYLFALVAGRLDCLKTEFKTHSGRIVNLKLYTEPGKTGQLHHARSSLLRAMIWDQEKYGLEYDLDDFHIVAVDDFNMGAMENKGLNIFNTKYVLASAESASDEDYKNIESIVAHEYFHNWTGNRVTCRDWFQLSLKEGLTVFRDQEFSADHHSKSLCRIHDVIRLRRLQFREDAGPLAHPIRPESYIEINNFYTSTVYEKGAEIIRMLQVFLGETCFIEAVKAYLLRYDGTATTCDDFIHTILEKAPERLRKGCLKNFIRWYQQAGTPEINITIDYDPNQKKLCLDIEQKPPANQPQNLPSAIPLLIKIFDQSSKKPFTLRADPACQEKLELRLNNEEALLHISKKYQVFCFHDIDSEPAVSINRNFSAPIHIKTNRCDDAFLMLHDDDPFIKWDALHQRAISLLRNKIHNRETAALVSAAPVSEAPVSDEEENFIEDWGKILASISDPALSAMMISLPAAGEMLDLIPYTDPQKIDSICENLKIQIARHYQEKLQDIYHRMMVKESFDLSREQQGKRALRNQLLSFLSIDNKEIAENHYNHSDNATERLAALRILARSQINHPALEDFLHRFGKDKLVFGKWLALQAVSYDRNCLSHIKKLMLHPSFSITNPNNIHALVSTFAQENIYHFHHSDGSGYAFLREIILKIDQFNPQTAARMATLFTRFNLLDPKRKDYMMGEMRTILDRKDLSNNLFEIISKALSQTDKKQNQ